MTKRIFLSPPWMGGRERQLVAEAFASGYVAPCGPMVDRFERALEVQTRVPHAAAVSSGTDALALVYHELGLGRGDVVVCSDLTFIASVGPAVQRGATPVFVDADPKTWTMDPKCLARALGELVVGRTGRTRKGGRVVVTAVDLFGQCCDYDAISRVCRRHGVPLVIDAAEALGATYRGRSAGAAGVASVLSFNGNKIITSSGGGAVLSQDSALVDRARRRAQQSRADAVWYEHHEIGYNMRLSNVSAAIGLGQLAYLKRILRRKRAIFARYEKALKGLLEPMPEAPYGECSRWLSVFRLPVAAELEADGPSLAVQRLLATFRAADIDARPVWKPMHLQPCFRGAAFYGTGVSTALFATGICLPSGAGLTASEQARVIRAVRDGLSGI